MTSIGTRGLKNIKRYNAFIQLERLPPIACQRLSTVEELLEAADVVSIHTVLDDSTRHLINPRGLAE